MKVCLFLCSGNYYRSRFAEEFFNFHATRQGLRWRAESRGLVPNLDSLSNPGPMSVFAIGELRRRGVEPRGARRYPISVTPAELAQATRIVALYEPEHLPMVRQFHPEWLPHVAFWQIGDLGDAEPVAAMAALERDVHRLLIDLSAEARPQIAQTV